MEDPLLTPPESVHVERAMLKLFLKSLPVIGTELFRHWIQVVNLLLVGRKDTAMLGGIGVGNLWFTLSVAAVSFGLGNGLERLSVQAYHHREYEKVGRWLHRSLVAAVVYFVLIAVVDLESEALFLAAGFEAEVAAHASVFTLTALPGVCFYLLEDCYRRTLQVQGYFWPGCTAKGVGAMLHPLVGYFLVHHFELDEVGVGLATSVTCVFTCALLRILALWVDVSQCQTHVTCSGFVSEMLVFYKTAIPTIAVFLLAISPLPLVQYIASFLGLQSLAAVLVLLTVEELVFIIPLGLSITLAHSVKRYINHGQPDTAKIYTVACVCLAALILVPVLVIFVSSSPLWAAAFTTVLPRQDLEIQDMISRTIYLTSLMTLVTSVDELLFGVLRALGKYVWLGVIYGVAYYLCCLPSSYLFTQVADLGLSGCMLGLTTGALVSIVPNVAALVKARWSPNKSG